MYKRMIFPLLGIMLLISACDNQTGVNNPVDGPAMNGAAAQLAQLDLTMEQAAFIDEMYYLEEDLSVLLDPTNYNVVRSLSSDPGPRMHAHRFIDMAAIVYFNLVMKANPDMDIATLRQIREWIAESNRTRARIIASGASREEIARLLQEEHERLMGEIKDLIGPEADRAVEALKQQLQEEREKRREIMQELRIDREVKIMTEKLGLTEEEAAAVKAALIWRHEQIARIRAEFMNNPEGMRAALQELLAQMERKMIAAIGEEKWEQWKNLRSGRTGEVRDPIAEQVKFLTRLLELDAEQAAKFTRILTAHQEKMKALVQRYGNDRRGLAEALRQLQLRTDEAIRAVLTREQLEIYIKYRRGGMHPGTGMRG